MEKKKEERKVLAKEALKALNDLEQTSMMENEVKDNKIEFKSGEKIYRVRKPTIVEQQEINNIRRKKYIEFVDDNSYLFKKQWIKKYKAKDIDIKKMEDDIKRMQTEIRNLLLKLAQIKDKKDVEGLKKEILSLRDKQYEISEIKSDLLSHSIEDQLTIYVNSYSTYMVLERKDGDKWVKYFNSYESFSSSKDWDLLNKAFYKINLLIYNVEN